MLERNTKFTQLAGGLALTAVMLGAFGAHALKSTLMDNNSVDTWKTAVTYQMWHALAILLICSLRGESNKHKLSIWAFTIGTVLFSGSLYWLALDGPKWLGPITPLGGLSFIVGWCSFIWSQKPKTKHI